VLETTSIFELEELQEGFQEEKPSSHRFKKSGRKYPICGWEYFLHLVWKGGESKQPSS